MIDFLLPKNVIDIKSLFWSSEKSVQLRREDVSAVQ